MKKTIILALLGSLTTGITTAQAAVDLTQVDQFISDTAEKNQLDPQWIRSIISQANHQQSIIDAMNKPAERTLRWFEYRKIFMTDKRVNEGVDFWNKHQDVIDKVSKDSGVDPEYIVAIIGVETFYGRIMGKHKVLDALYTLAFDYPKRSKFFTKELAHFLLLANEQHVNALEAQGSYAGAMGFGQFMPSSYRSYAVDYEKDEKIDLLNNPQDAIASVANYLARHGWVKGGAVVETLAPSALKDVKNNQLKPHLKDVAGRDYTQLALKTSETETEHWKGLQNFYVISRYNHSHLYVMAVHQVAQAIKQAKTATKVAQ